MVEGSSALGAVVGGAAGTAVGALWEDIHKALKEKHAHGAPRALHAAVLT
jgi:hypothetical protein